MLSCWKSSGCQGGVKHREHLWHQDTIKTLTARKRGSASSAGVWCECVCLAAFPHNLALRDDTLPPLSLRATVPAARPNEGQGCAFVSRSSFASRRQAASQDLFKGAANPITLLICEALSPRTPASVGTTSQGTVRLPLVIGPDRKSEGSMHHKASTRLSLSRQWQSEGREALTFASHVMTAPPGETAWLHIGVAVRIRLVEFHLYPLVNMKQRRRGVEKCTNGTK